MKTVDFKVSPPTERHHALNCKKPGSRSLLCVMGLVWAVKHNCFPMSLEHFISLPWAWPGWAGYLLFLSPSKHLLMEAPLVCIKGQELRNVLINKSISANEPSDGCLVAPNCPQTGLCPASGSGRRCSGDNRQGQKRLVQPHFSLSSKFRSSMFNFLLSLFYS